MKKIRIFLEYITAFMIIFFLLFLIASAVVVKFYGNDVQDYAFELLNEQLDTKVSVDEIGLSILKKFPYTTVYFNQVTVWSGHIFNRNEFPDFSTDTLLFAERLFVKFNLMDLLKNKYTVKELEVKTGGINVFIDSEGKGNFLIDEKENKSKPEKQIELKGVALRDIKVKYLNLSKAMQANVVLNEVFLEGNFAKENYLLRISGDSYLQDVAKEEFVYLKEKKLKTDLQLKVAGNYFIIQKGEIRLGELNTSVTGEILSDKNVGLDLNVKLKAQNIDLEWISSIIASLYDMPEGYSGKGKLDLTVDVTGLLTSKLDPHIEARFSTQNSEITLTKIPLQIKSVSLNGIYSNGVFNSLESSSIEMSRISARVGNSTFLATFFLENFSNPKFNMTINGELNAEEVNKYLPDLPLELKAGIIIPKLSLTGGFSDHNPDSKTIKIEPSGTIQTKDLVLTASSKDIKINALNSLTMISQKEISSTISGFLYDTDFKMNLVIPDPFILTNGVPNLSIKGDIYSTLLDFDTLLSMFTTEVAGEQSNLLPKNINLEMDFHFDRIKKGEISSKKVSGVLLYEYPGIYIQPFFLETMSGTIDSKVALLDLDKEIHKLNISTSYKNVDIQEAFKSFNNFGQDFLSYDNIAGTISGASEFRSNMSNSFSIKSSDIVSENNFIIENGELINFEPIIELSKFLKIDKMDHVSFSKIENTIMIKENKITIPLMDINSSAINLKASGTHSFEKTFEYHLAIKLSEILFNKAKNAKNQEFNVALDKNDQRTIFLVIYDKGEGMVVEFDEEQAREKVRNDLKNEKTELKIILNEEFGFFKKNEAIQEKVPREEESILQFEFLEDPMQDSVKIQTNEKTKWWKRKSETDKKPELNFVIDDIIP